MQHCRERGKWFGFSAVIGYDRTHGMVGQEQLLVAMMDDPNWVADMFMTVAELTIAAAQEMTGAGIEFDGVFICDDMGYRNAPLFSPKIYKEICFPAHKKMMDFFHSKGLKVIMHSCGNVKVLIPHLIEAGLDCLQPLEVKAGMDLIELKKAYGDRLAFMGGIDARAMSDPDPSVIEREIETKITVAKKGGGYIYHSDHSVPSDVSFEQYKRVIELVRKYGKH